MKNKKLIRQGDVLLVPCAQKSIPAEAIARKPEDGRLILARGEATGHHHSIAADSSTALLATPNNEMYLLVKEGDAILEHQEHSAHKIKKGAYRVVIQQEYHPEAIRNVAD